MAVEVGQKVSGKVTGITNFGAFVSLPENQSGLVHISEISEGFVKDINDFLRVGEEVEVKVLKITPDGKINLSIRKAVESAPEVRDKPKYEKKPVASHKTSRNINPKATFNQTNNATNNDFDNLMGQFLKDSEDRLTSLRRNTEGKRGGRGGRRG